VARFLGNTTSSVNRLAREAEAGSIGRKE